MIALFERDLLKMEQEVRDLKTIHERGLGTIKFYEYTYQTTISQNTTFRAMLTTGEPEYPLALAMANIQEPTGGAFILSATGRDFVLIAVIPSQISPLNVKIKMISSSKLDGIEVVQ